MQLLVEEGSRGCVLRWKDPTLGLRDGIRRLAEPAHADALTQALSSLPWEACFLEAPPLRAGGSGAFELMVIPAPSLRGVKEDPVPFREPLQRAERQGDPLAIFLSLGGDAVLVSPCSREPGVDHAHLLSFLRTASLEASRALWRGCVQALAGRGERETWLSTSGLGVSWLHLRLEDRPKYFQGPYRWR